MQKLKTKKAVTTIILGSLVVSLGVLIVEPLRFSQKVYEEFLASHTKGIERLHHGSIAAATEVYDSQNNKIGEFSSVKRYFRPLDSIHKDVIHAFLAAEDKDFYYHIGIDPKSIIRATWTNISNGRITQGASTITQQLARLYFLDRKKTFLRKAKEAILAVALERKLSKNQILELYLNKIFLGNHSYGVEAAAQNYFRKGAHELNIGEAALLAALPKAPSRLALNKHYRRAKTRQRLILSLMRDNGFISETAYQHWLTKKVTVYRHRKNHKNDAPYFLKLVKGELERKFEFRSLETKGLKVFTTLNSPLQKSISSKWMGFLTQTNRIARNDRIEGAVVVVSPMTGAVLALQGGSSFQRTEFNRALYTKRPIGSSLLPALSAFVVDQSYFPGSNILSRVNRMMQTGTVSAFHQPISELGFFPFQSFLNAIGLKLDISDLRVLDGKGSLSPLQFTEGHMALFNGGRILETFSITKVIDQKGRVLYQKPRNTIVKKIFAPIQSKAIQNFFSSKQTYSHTGIAPHSKNAWNILHSQERLIGSWVGAERGRTQIPHLAIKKMSAVAQKMIELKPSKKLARPGARQHPIRRKTF